MGEWINRALTVVGVLNLSKVCRKVKERAGSGPGFLTFDIDFVDSAYAPATGTPEVGRFTSWECQEMILRLAG